MVKTQSKIFIIIDIIHSTKKINIYPNLTTQFYERIQKMRHRSLL